MPRDGFNFRSGKVISQQGVDFAAKGHFCSPFHSCEMRGGGLRNGTRVPRSGFAAAKWGYGCEIGIFKALGISQSISQLRNEARGCEMALMCQGSVSQLRKFSQREGMGL